MSNLKTLAQIKKKKNAVDTKNAGKTISFFLIKRVSIKNEYWFITKTWYEK